MWGAYNWLAFRWGEGTADLPVAIGKLISESITPDSAINGFDSVHLISEIISLDSDMTDERLTDGSGYTYVFPSDVTNHENQSLASYTTGSSPNNTWTSATAGSSNWS